MSTDESSGWRPVENQRDIDELMRLFGNFHDGCIRELHVATGDYVHQDLSMTVDWRTTVHVLVQRQSRHTPAIELRFGELIGLRLDAPPPDHENITNDAEIRVRDGVFYWIPNSFNTPDPPVDGTWIAARKLWWREAEGWLGPELRYR